MILRTDKLLVANVYPHVLEIGTRLLNLDPRSDYAMLEVVDFTYVNNRWVVEIQNIETGRHSKISAERMSKTWGHRNGYKYIG